MNFPLKFRHLTFASSEAHTVALSYDYSSHAHRKQAIGFHIFLSHPNYDFTAFSKAFSDKAAVFLQFPEVKMQNLDILKFNYVTTKSTQHKNIFLNNRLYNLFTKLY